MNHTAWTEYFGDSPLTKSLNMDVVPDVPQIHYVGSDDAVVPPDLIQIPSIADNRIIVPNAVHGDFGDLRLDFIY